VAAMMEPGFYPKPPAKVTHKETHISHLFFAGDLVYKVKKAVRYSFLDYSTLTKRRYFLNEELRLNRRLAPSVYLGVMPITLDASGWRLGGWAEPAEYTLVMRRLPEKRMLPFLLETRQVTPEMMRELAGVLAKFHAEAERAKGIEPGLYPPLAEKQWDENLTDLNPFIGLLIDSETYEAVKRSGAVFIRDHAELLRQRAQEGWIREVHGDLHCDHICFAPEGIQVFDCIEFDPKLRCCDLAAEIAFFLMDLEVRGGQALTQPFLTRYRELLADQELPVLLPFYKCYRALVRTKVHALRPGGAVDAARYFRYATRLTWERLPPFLLIICGLTGSGKSTLASELGERLGLPVINSDTTRKALAAKPGRQAVPFGEGIYRRTMTERTYAKMIRQAEKQILKGNGAILDATFAQRGNRGKVVRLAEKRRVRLFLIHCSAADEIIHGRLTQRAAAGKDTSDGRWEIYEEQRAAYEPITEVPAESCLELNTEAPLDQLAGACEKFLRSELDKVRPAI
jgi:aminoglycoside phosphotransferase family enzyme/predicted kinase